MDRSAARSQPSSIENFPFEPCDDPLKDARDFESLRQGQYLARFVFQNGDQRLLSALKTLRKWGCHVNYVPCLGKEPKQLCVVRHPSGIFLFFMIKLLFRACKVAVRFSKTSPRMAGVRRSAGRFSIVTRKFGSHYKTYAGRSVSGAG